MYLYSTSTKLSIDVWLYLDRPGSLTNILVELKDDISTGCRIVDKDFIDACNSIFTKVRVSTILHRPPQIYIRVKVIDMICDLDAGYLFKQP